MDEAAIKNFHEHLLEWYRTHERPLPWKDLDDPYLIWVSEIMLQQTRADQVWDYFLRFTEAFPTVQALANATEDEVLSLWKGLGFYARARNLHSAACHVVREHDGNIPPNYDDLLELKGIGPYTASAIASLAFGKPRAVLDGNVHRVLSRFMGWEKNLGSSADKRTFQQLADRLIDPRHPASFNQAMMDLGAVICTPSQPLCEECPLSAECVAKAEKAWDQYPPVKKRPKVSTRFFHYLYCTDGKRIALQKRQGDDIWKGLYELPLRETNDNRWLNREEITGLADLSVSNTSALQAANWACFTKIFSQRLSHQQIHGRFYLCLLDVNTNGFTVLNHNIEEANNLGLPRMIDCFLEENFVYLENLHN